MIGSGSEISDSMAQFLYIVDRYNSTFLYNEIVVIIALCGP